MPDTPVFPANGESPENAFSQRPSYTPPETQPPPVQQTWAGVGGSTQSFAPVPPGPADPSWAPGVGLPYPPPPPAYAQIPPPPPTRGVNGVKALLIGFVALVVLTGGALLVVKLTDSGQPTASPTASSSADNEQTGAFAPPDGPSGSAGPTDGPTSAPATTTPPTKAAPPKPGDLIGSDDFNGSTPDLSKWGIYHSTDATGSWFKDMVRVADGTLRIVGEGRNPTGAGNRSGGLCWCGPTADQVYGKWQIRARFGAGAGYGQLIGLWPKSNDGNDGHVTIASAREPAKTKVHASVWADASPSTEGTLTGTFTAWHTYTIEWRATFVRIQVDGRTIYDSAVAKGKIPKIPMHLYLQQTVGPKDGVPAPDSATPDQVVMEIDWVKVYR